MNLAPSGVVTPSTSAPSAPPRSTRPDRGWALAGVGAAVLSLAGLAASMEVDAVYDTAIAGDAVAIAERLAERSSAMYVAHVGTLGGALLLVVFALGLGRYLRTHVPTGSLLPGVTAAGLGMVVVAGLMGTAFTTEALFGAGDEHLLPEVAAVFAHWIGTVAWLWVGAGLAALAFGHAALRHQAAGRMLGVFSLVLGGLTLLLGLAPLQYMAAFTGPVWLLVVTVALLRRTTRAAMATASPAIAAS